MASTWTIGSLPAMSLSATLSDTWGSRISVRLRAGPKSGSTITDRKGSGIRADLTFEGFKLDHPLPLGEGLGEGKRQPHPRPLSGTERGVAETWKPSAPGSR